MPAATAEWARLLAESLGRDDIAQDAHDVALLADIGHLALVDTRDNPWLEWQRRRASHDLLRAIPALAHLAPAVLSVSERFDGDGLPFGLSGDEIPLVARIARLVRDFDLASQGWWPGQPAGISARACFELVSLAGQTVDPALVHTWLRVLDREVRVSPDDLDSRIMRAGVDDDSVQLHSACVGENRRQAVRKPSRPLLCDTTITASFITIHL